MQQLRNINGGSQREKKKKGKERRSRKERLEKATLLRRPWSVFGARGRESKTSPQDWKKG